MVTPNEGLSEQHLVEFATSGIPDRRFDLNHNGLWSDSKHTVQVIEITKLVKEKRGGGISVLVEAFEGRNLIFVGEGYKDSGGEVWRKYRDALGETGFPFEYSATFEQALSAVRNDLLTTEYGKAIVFAGRFPYVRETALTAEALYDDILRRVFHSLLFTDINRPDTPLNILIGAKKFMKGWNSWRVSNDVFNQVRSVNLGTRIGLEPKEIPIRPMKREWASCSSLGRLTFAADLLY